MPRMRGAGQDPQAALHRRKRWRGGTEPRRPRWAWSGPKGVGFESLLPIAGTDPELRCLFCVSFGAVDLADHLVPDPEVLVHCRNGSLRVVVPYGFEDR